MKVSLINIDGREPNLALEKIAMYHRLKGDDVFFDMPLMPCNKTYISCIFSWNKHKCGKYGKAELGGTGYDINKKLPDEIEEMKPKINWGFSTRGCFRKCKFCIVPQKEGKIRIVGDLYDLWDGKSKKITLLDNNILGLPEHFSLICEQARKNNIKLDFNQGLDHRLLTDKIITDMKSISHVEYRFAFDDITQESSVRKAIRLLKDGGINRCQWYVLVGFNETFSQELHRLNLLKSLNQNAYVQRYNWTRKPHYIALARWSNQMNLFQAMTFEKFMERKENHKYIEAVKSAL